MTGREETDEEYRQRLQRERDRRRRENRDGLLEVAAILGLIVVMLGAVVVITWLSGMAPGLVIIGDPP